MSGFAAPARTATPVPTRARISLLSGTTFPCCTRSSIAPLPDIATSTISPLTMRLLISAGGARLSVILCSLVRWNSPASSVSTWFIARVVNTLISAASEAVGAAHAMAKPIVTVIRER
jgi:hypothetical protein